MCDSAFAFRLVKVPQHIAFGLPLPCQPFALRSHKRRGPLWLPRGHPMKSPNEQGEAGEVLLVCKFFSFHAQAQERISRILEIVKGQETKTKKKDKKVCRSLGASSKSPAI